MKRWSHANIRLAHCHQHQLLPRFSKQSKCILKYRARNFLLLEKDAVSVNAFKAAKSKLLGHSYGPRSHSLSPIYFVKRLSPFWLKQQLRKQNSIFILKAQAQLFGRTTADVERQLVPQPPTVIHQYEYPGHSITDLKASLKQSSRDTHPSTAQS